MHDWMQRHIVTLNEATLPYTYLIKLVKRRSLWFCVFKESVSREHSVGIKLDGEESIVRLIDNFDSEEVYIAVIFSSCTNLCGAFCIKSDWITFEEELHPLVVLLRRKRHYRPHCCQRRQSILKTRGVVDPSLKMWGCRGS